MASAEATSSAMTSSWTSLKTPTTNATSHLAPSPKDLLLAVPRMAARAGSFVTEGLPEAFENIFGGGITGRTIAEATSERAGEMAAAAVSATTGPGATVAGAGAAPVQSAAVGNSSIFSVLTFQRIKSFGGIFSYMTSKWALGCFAAAIILNRTSIYAASRHHLHLDWQLRVALRIVPIVLLYNETISLLRAIRCQTSPQFSFMRYGSSDQHIALDFAGEGGFLQSFSAWQLFWESEEASCLNIGMIPTKDNPTHALGSLSLIWPAFLMFFFSQWVETLSCAIQGRNTATETGMSLFEHSLAYAEAQAMVETQTRLPSLGSTPSSIGKLVDSKREAGDPLILPMKDTVLNRFNTPPEVLLMSLLSSLNHLTSHILGIFGLQSKYRLLNTGFWGLCFMFSFWWGFLSLSLEAGFDAPLFRFPTVCIVGFIPHILIVAGISLCACIYGFALVLSVFSPPEDVRRARTWRQRFLHAHQNMQASSQLSGLRLHWHEDFYTALLRAGFTALMAASEAVFLNEGRSINVGQWTWLEEDRMNEILRNRSAPTNANGALEQAFDITQDISVAIDDDDGKLLGQSKWKSGYSRERSTKALKNKAVGVGARNQDMVGAFQRSGRYVLALDFLLKIFWLLVGWSILSVEKLVQKFGIQWRPKWVQNLLAASKKGSKLEPTASSSVPKELDFWMLTDDGELTLPRDNNIDVEQEIKRRLRFTNPSFGWNDNQKAELDSRLYSWFKHGGWWGERDSSGDYQPPHPDDEDNTSVLSFSETESESGWESESSGRRTPTLSDPNPSTTTRAINDTSLDPFHLASLLNPRTPEQRDEARMLSARLTTQKPLTRSQFSRLSDSENAHLLTSTKYRPADFRPSDPSGKLTAIEEAEILEYLIIRFRNNKTSRGAGAGRGSQNWSEGAEGLGAGGPMCVVCQSSPRTILAWPCRCLSLCEECRVSLAMNNFGTCVCCRQEVVGFSRLFVP